MKKTSMLTMAVLASAAIFMGCQKQLADQSPSSDANLKNLSGVKMLTAGASCETGGCIEVGEESFADSAIGKYNPNFSAVAYLSNDDDELIFRFGSNRDIHYIKVADSVVFCSATDNGGDPLDSTTFEYRIPIGTFGTDWFECDDSTYTISIYRNNCSGNGAGNATTFTISHKLVPVCTCDAELLTYQTADNLNIVFSYNDDEKLTNAKVEFTFPQVLNLPLTDGKYVAPDGKIYEVNNPTNQTVFTWYGDLPCRTDDAITFAFSHLPDCNPNAQDHQAIIWTDFKVNGETKKGTNANIVAACP